MKYVLFPIILISLIYFLRNSSIKNKGENFVAKLETLGYFKYAENQHIEYLKKEKAKDFEKYMELLPCKQFEKTTIPIDYRYYSCDGEEVYEAQGVTNLIKTLQPTFDKINFKCEITNHFEEWDTENNWLNHQITINGTTYVLFKNSKELGWGEAPLRISQALNNEFEKQGIQEKIYLISGGNDGWLIFLTPELHQYIVSVCKKTNSLPYELSEWAKMMKIQPMQF